MARSCKRGDLKNMDIPPSVQCQIDEVGGLEAIHKKLAKDELIMEETKIHNALSNFYRGKIVHLLAIQPLCVCVIKEFIDISDSKISYHLSVLKRNGLIESKQEGKWLIYSLTKKGEESIIK